jgi:anthranilate synthase component 2
MCREVKVTEYSKLAGNQNWEADGILIGPGPGHPSEYPELNRVIGESCGKVPVLGVCLGHQVICGHFGASYKNLKQVWHGIERKTMVLDKQDPLFESIPDTFMSGRYHSWAVSEVNFPKCLKITSSDEDGTIMSVKHTLYNIQGIQFHPESIMTPVGKTIIRNWLETLSPKT